MPLISVSIQIELAELGDVMRSLSVDVTDKEIKENMDEFDYDGNGAIDFSEVIIIIHMRIVLWAKSGWSREARIKLFLSFLTLRPRK